MLQLTVCLRNQVIFSFYLVNILLITTFHVGKDSQCSRLPFKMFLIYFYLHVDNWINASQLSIVFKKFNILEMFIVNSKFSLQKNQRKFLYEQSSNLGGREKLFLYILEKTFSKLSAVVQAKYLKIWAMINAVLKTVFILPTLQLTVLQCIYCNII